MAALRAEPDADGRRLTIYRRGQSEPLLVQHAEDGRRPYIHPLLAPDGMGVLTEDAPAHHPWQHGLYVGLNAVNGVGFWTENETDGTFHPGPLSDVSAQDNTAGWAVESAWRAPDGADLLVESQAWAFTDLTDCYFLDMDWRLRAETNLTFGQYAYGGLFLRMPYRPETGGTALNSEGQENNDTEGRRARWVSVTMPIAGRADNAGIVLMDHPGNPEHPVPWRVDKQLGIAPSRSIAGEWRLAKDEETVSRYRLYIFCGDADPKYIEEVWKAFAAERDS